MLTLLHCLDINTSSGPKQLKILLNNHEPFNVVATLNGKVVAEASRDRLSLEMILDIVKALDDAPRSK